jgi:hypothetical protein
MDTPLIFSPPPVRSRMDTGDRAMALMISMICLAVLITAALLPPSPDGMGTHTRLGLQSCEFYKNYHIPCPSCGMTTSFAWFARGNLLASFYVQPMGTALALLAAISFWTGLYVAITGRAAHRLLLILPSRYYVIPLLSWAIIAWGWKIFIHTHGIDGWHS